jgi:LPXTG-motif cell wall-anchored protein
VCGQNSVCWYPDCCHDSDCHGCQTCIQGYCEWACDESSCCEDGKGGRFCSEGGECCNDEQCQYEGSACGFCHGGYCLDCSDREPEGTLQCCADLLDVSAAEGRGPECAQCCSDYDCGPCGACRGGWCDYDVCDEHKKICCEGYGCAEECCSDSDCGACEECREGKCYSDCDRGEICCQNGLEPYCADKEYGCCGGQGDWCVEVRPLDGSLDGSCCDGFYCCSDDKKGSSCSECCHDDHCEGDWVCCGGYCAECCDDHDCEGYDVCVEGACVECRHDKDCDWGVCVDGYCVECRDHWDCGKGEVCCNVEYEGGGIGYACVEAECCGDWDCGDCEYCREGWCRQQGVGFGETCQPYDLIGIASADESSPQLNCCDGLFCCETGKHDHLTCLQCCHDSDCAHGCECHDGVCSCGCSHDKDCADGTCCCKNGSCSEHCCPKKPGKPDDKPDDSTSVGGETVAVLPSTGTGSSQSNAGWIGAAALGAAAAYMVSKSLKDDSPETQPAED